MFTLLFSVRDCFRARAVLQAEILALRHQLLVLQRSSRPHKLRLGWAERLIGSIRRECLDHVIVFHQAGLRRILKDYFEYYERCRTHLSLEKDAPVSRPVELPSLG